MNLGIDLRPLQLHFKYRGIGMHIIELMHTIPSYLKENDKLFIYMYRGDNSPLAYLPKTVNYEVVYLPKPYPPGKRWLPFFVKEGVLKLRQIYSPIPKEYFKVCDVWLGFDFMLGFPEYGANTKVAYVLYDLIPLIYEKEYFQSFLKIWHKQNFHEASRDTLTKHLYRWAVNELSSRADMLLPISKSTLRQIEKFNPRVVKKSKVIYLGSPRKSHITPRAKSANYKNSKFIFYIGGGDPRRKIEDLVFAFDKLKIYEPTLKLILAGNDFRSLKTIPTQRIARSIKESKYRKDIKLLGFIKEEEKLWFYQNAVCFAFPSVIEGFGLPLLEAMQEGCPVVAYSSHLSSTKEVAGEAAILVGEDKSKLYEAIKDLLNTETRERISKKSRNVPLRFSWDKNAQETVDALRRLAST